MVESASQPSGLRRFSAEITTSLTPMVLLPDARKQLPLVKCQV